MNKRTEEVGYRPFEAQPILQKGILPIERDDGSMERRVAAGLARIAEESFQQAAQTAQFEGERAGQRDALLGAPEASAISGGIEQQARQIGHRVTVAPPAIKQIVTDAANRHGQDPEALLEVARIESNFNPDAANPDSTAEGLFQFIDGTARGYGLKNKRDATQSSDAAARLMRDNRAFLLKSLGREPTGGELYLAHQQGADGARKLLANPNARAIDIVGADAIKLNGGSADMTAGQFASLWTSKVHAGSQNVALEDRDGPIRMIPVSDPVSIVPGKRGTFRPTGSNTIRGRAYDVAGTRTYLQMAKMTIIEDQAQVYDKFKDDPVQLQAAMGQLLEAHKRDGNYFPEIAPEYELSFKQNAFDLQRQAVSEQDRRKRETDQVEFLDRVGGLENRKSQLMAGLDPRDPQASSMLDNIQATIDDHYDSAVSRGVMSPLKAEEAKRSSRSDMTVGYYLKQAAGLKTTEIEQLQTKMTEDYASGKLKGVTAEDWAKIDDGMRSAVSARRTGDKTANENLTSRGDDIAARILRGEQVAPDELARMRTDAQTASDGDSILASTDAKVRLASALRTRPIGDVEARLPEILKRPDGTTSAEDVAYARKQIDDTRKELTVDPLGVAEKFGIIPPASPITVDGMTDPAKLRDALAYRRGAAVAAADHFGVPVRYFRPGEADQVAAAAMQNPDAMVAFTLNVTNSFGKDTPAAMREISEVGPVMAHAVGVAVATGDTSLARDVAKINVMKAKKEIDIKVPDADLTVKGSEFLDGALAAKPEMQQAAISTAKLLFTKMAWEQGFDPGAIATDPVVQAAWDKSLDRALGGQSINGVDSGGISTVNGRNIIVPALMPKERVENLFYGMTESQLSVLPKTGTINGVKVTAAQMKDGYLVTVGDGLYRVATNDPESDDPAYVIGQDGRPWVLDIRQLNELQKAKPVSAAPNRAQVFKGGN